MCFCWKCEKLICFHVVFHFRPYGVCTVVNGMFFTKPHFFTLFKVVFFCLGFLCVIRSQRTLILCVCRCLTWHKIIGPFASSRIRLQAISLWPHFNRAWQNAISICLFQMYSFLPFDKAFLLKKYVTNGLWINKQPNWMGFYTRWCSKGWHLFHFILISDISGRVHFHTTERHNAFILFSSH